MRRYEEGIWIEDQPEDGVITKVAKWFNDMIKSWKASI